MSFGEALARYIVGGSLILFVGILGKSGRKEIADLLVLFPVATVVGLYYLSKVQSGVELQRTVLLSVHSVPTILVFLFITEHSSCHHIDTTIRENIISSIRQLS